MEQLEAMFTAAYILGDVMLVVGAIIIAVEIIKAIAIGKPSYTSIAAIEFTMGALTYLTIIFLFEEWVKLMGVI